MKPQQLPPPFQYANNQLVTRKPRESNLELFRVVTMLLIIAHHFVVNSDVAQVIRDNPQEVASRFLLLFGAWGKTGINCFVLITGYFMCKSSISLHKFLKLVTQILFYNLVIFGIFIIAGQEDFSIRHLIGKLLVVKNMDGGFTSGFIMFYLLIPFLSILVNNLSQRQHLALVALVIFTFTICGSVAPPLPIRVTVNYVLHFSNLFIIASYVRLHGFPLKLSHSAWGWLTLGSLTLGATSVLALNHLAPQSGFFCFHFVSDSNKILAMAVAFSAFMWFKELRIGYSKTINLLGGATFGVLLIHANSDTMRQWLWNEVVDCAGHFTDPRLWLYAPSCVVVIFIVCAALEILRQRYIENPVVKWSNSAINKLRPYTNL